MGSNSYAIDSANDPSPPDYERVARALCDADLEDEILSRRGEPAYQLALLAEAERRANQEEQA